MRYLSQCVSQLYKMGLTQLKFIENGIAGWLKEYRISYNADPLMRFHPRNSYKVHVPRI